MALRSAFTPWYITKQMLMSYGIMAAFYFAGDWLDKQEDQRMIKFRDKSALYGRELKPGEPPSWP